MNRGTKLALGLGSAAAVLAFAIQVAPTFISYMRNRDKESFDAAVEPFSAEVCYFVEEEIWCDTVAEQYEVAYTEVDYGATASSYFGEIFVSVIAGVSTAALTKKLEPLLDK